MYDMGQAVAQNTRKATHEVRLYMQNKTSQKHTHKWLVRQLAHTARYKTIPQSKLVGLPLIVLHRNQTKQITSELTKRYGQAKAQTRQNDPQTYALIIICT